MYVRRVFRGYDWESWRTVLLLALATIAVGVAVGFLAYVIHDRPDEVTCAEMETDVSKRLLVSDEVARDLDIPGEPIDRVALIVADEIEQGCTSKSSSHRPVTSDLRGTVRQRLEGPSGER